VGRRDLNEEHLAGAGRAEQDIRAETGMRTFYFHRIEVLRQIVLFDGISRAGKSEALFEVGAGLRDGAEEVERNLLLQRRPISIREYPLGDMVQVSLRIAHLVDPVREVLHLLSAEAGDHCSATAGAPEGRTFVASLRRQLVDVEQTPRRCECVPISGAHD
jgi:hypothetical protein